VVYVEDIVISVTISGGVSSHKVGETLEMLTKRADLLLYKAKKEGRNRNMEEE